MAQTEMALLAGSGAAFKVHLAQGLFCGWPASRPWKACDARCLGGLVLTLRECVALLLYQRLLQAAMAEDVGTLQRTDAVAPTDVLAAAGDLLEQHGLISCRFGDGGYVRRSQALRHLLQTLELHS